ncbi:MAG: macro domain-containing protein [Candidatus Mcinerneyibacterium aminivorans]|uniref:Macro domain-containing protein n=1 Tax=Candidatus Mcinerneyibacterium aminivorans TaxID=2703815 RepID=A0A5D0MHD0_9BACT|nr:MAG: macro domain-containing protein [Candidatus Mcinerneyibacterium aminivorans]
MIEQLELKKGDITNLDVDAIINPANTQLIMGGGVAGAIRKKGGEEIQKECHKKSPINIGEVVITSGGKLKADYVIHAVGPRKSTPNRKKLLTKAVKNSLKIADDYGIKSLAFPAISTGVFGYPLKEAAEVILSTIKNYLNFHNSSIEKVIVILYDNKTYKIFNNINKKIK